MRTRDQHSPTLARRLTILLTAGLIAALVLPGSAATAATDPTTLVLRETNDHRADEGLKPLRLQTRITSVSSDWSAHMKATRKLAHNPRFSSQIPGDHLGAGENVGYACGYGGASANTAVVMKAWLKSSGHEANIAGRYTDIGIGIKYSPGTDCVWATQNFARYSGKFSSTPRPWITGTSAVGKKLSGHPGTWTPSASVSYRWLRDGKAISGATSKYYTTTKADRGHQIRVQVTGKRSGYLTTSTKSVAVTIR